MTRCSRLFLLLSILVVTQCVDSARILGLFTFSSKSHLIVHTSVIEPLVERGHDVTVVTTASIPRRNNGYRHINLDFPDMSSDFFNKMLHEPPPLYKRFGILMEKVTESANASLNHPLMRQLMENESFDLLILGYFFNEFQLGVAAHFKCPVVVSFMVQPVRIVNDLVGNPRELTYVPNLFSGGVQPLDFWGRVKNFLFVTFLEEMVIPFWSSGVQKSLYRVEGKQIVFALPVGDNLVCDNWKSWKCCLSTR